MIAPAATNSSEPSSDIVTWLKYSGASFHVPMRRLCVAHVLSMCGQRSQVAPFTSTVLLIKPQLGAFGSGTVVNHLSMSAASRSQVTTSPISPAMPRARACFIASPPSPCKVRRVVAAAMPLGNGNCSMLIICRLVGIAKNTPSIEISATQGISHMQRS